MKKIKVLLIAVFLLSAGSSFQIINAQEKTKAEQEKEAKLQQAIDFQKKAITEQKKAQEEVSQELKEKQIELDNNLNDIQVQVEASGQAGDALRERTTWDFSKSVKENTFTRDYTFDVEKTVNSVVMSVMGDCKAGDIHIKIIMPNGKSYSDIIIDEFGNLNWRKSFSISETENQDKTGEWKFQIASNKATGFFKISLQTY
jgi:Zn-dependent metalloprotease